MLGCDISNCHVSSSQDKLKLPGHAHSYLLLPRLGTFSCLWREKWVFFYKSANQTVQCLHTSFAFFLTGAKKYKTIFELTHSTCQLTHKRATTVFFFDFYTNKRRTQEYILRSATTATLFTIAHLFRSSNGIFILFLPFFFIIFFPPPYLFFWAAHG